MVDLETVAVPMRAKPALIKSLLNSFFLLLSHHQQSKCSGFHGAAGALLAFCRRSFVELRSHCVDVMIGGIKSHGAGRALGRRVLYRGIFVWRIFVDNGQVALTI